jgi:hypothetical protein
MTRRLRLLATLYIAAGLYGLYREQKGELHCGCGEGCWCKRPGLNVFRWVFPFGHEDA